MVSGQHHLRFQLLLVIFGFVFCTICMGQEFQGVCDKPRNANLPFCDSNLPIDTRVQDLLTRLTVDEKIGLLDHTASGASENVDLDEYTWWNEALHGMALSPGVKFVDPTPHSTSFPQIINLVSSFNKQLFFEMGNTTGNEARAFFNSGNSGLTFWGPNNNIFRDPRWGRGHETPGEDPYLSKQFAMGFIRGMQGEHPDGFLKSSACCKHFAAHSQEEDRFAFNSIVNDQDMADTYLPVFKSCVEEAGVSCIMCAYNAVNGVPACANHDLLQGTLRQEWGFDGYITTDCGGVEMLQREDGHNYTETEPDTCAAILNSGVDLECHWELEGAGVFARALAPALDQGKVTVQMMDTALGRLSRVLMRLGWFEKEATRPYKELLPPLVDSEPHKQLALHAARQSIVLLKNAPNVGGGRAGVAPLPIDAMELRGRKGSRRASMALIGPNIHGDKCTGIPYPYGCNLWLANYNGIPSEVKEPLAEIRKYIPDVEFEFGCELEGFNDSRLQAAEDLAKESAQVVLFVGLHGHIVEREGRDRDNLSLPGLQNELIRRVIAVAQEPVILIVVSGGALDLEEWQNDPRVGAIIWAGYLGQAAGEAIADVIFGVYNPSGRLAQTWYSNEYVNQVEKHDMRMRPVDGSPGRTYRFFTGQPIYPFGYGLSYTSFAYAFDDSTTTIKIKETKTEADDDDCTINVNVTVKNTGTRAGDHSVLWFVAPPNAGQGGRPIKSLLNFDRVDNVAPLQSRTVTLCLNRNDFQLADEGGEFSVVPGQWSLTVGSLQRSILVV